MENHLFDRAKEACGNDNHAAGIHDYKGKIETKLSKICEGIFSVFDSKLIVFASIGDSKLFYLKMKGDYHSGGYNIKTGAGCLIVLFFIWSTLICGGCNCDIGYGNYLGCMGMFFHPSCFCCYACHLPITEHEFSLSGKEAYHKFCLNKLTNPKCKVCHQFVRNPII